jgi:hypothetical protein
MRRWLAALTALAAGLTAAWAEEPNRCAVPADLIQTDAKLEHVAAKAAKDHTLTVVVVGTGSSVLPGADGAQKAYPARLAAALAQRLPGIRSSVAADVKLRRTAAEEVKDFARILVDAKPDLVIWQTGTVDAIRGVDPDSFLATLEAGVKALTDGGADVILVNMQYSPRTESMISIRNYADDMHWVAQEHALPLFDRLAIMRHWNESGTFNLSAVTSSGQIAADVHDCIGRLLADLIIDAASLGGTREPH